VGPGARVPRAAAFPGEPFAFSGDLLPSPGERFAFPDDGTTIRQRTEQ